MRSIRFSFSPHRKIRSASFRFRNAYPAARPTITQSSPPSTLSSASCGVFLKPFFQRFRHRADHHIHRHFSEEKRILFIDSFFLRQLDQFRLRIAKNPVFSCQHPADFIGIASTLSSNGNNHRSPLSFSPRIAKKPYCLGTPIASRISAGSWITNFAPCSFKKSSSRNPHPTMITSTPAF